MSVIVGEIVAVTATETDWPGVNLMPSLFQVMAIGPLALEGLQFVVDKLNNNDTPWPVFSTYMVWVTDVPGVTLPQLTLVKGMVQALSAKTPTPGVTFTFPFAFSDLFKLSIE